MKAYDELVESIERIRLEEDIFQKLYNSQEDKLLLGIKNGEIVIGKDIIKMINEHSTRYLIIEDVMSKRWYVVDRNAFIPKYKFDYNFLRSDE